MRRVLKVGGSLLADPKLPSKLNSWLANNSQMQNVIIVGGGIMVDQIRDLADVHRHRLTDQQSHDLACRAMSGTARLVHSLLGDSSIPLIGDSLDQLAESKSPVVVFDSSNWILAQPNVPNNWDFTSDSIAARLATELDADELVLIKSRAGELDEPGFVDAYFANESKSVKSVRVCTLIA